MPANILRKEQKQNANKTNLLYVLADQSDNGYTVISFHLMILSYKALVRQSPSSLSSAL
jgi:hypothetical protein